jgi:3-(3-hydroxy-phenyl)propionate hydroxylase
MMREENVLPVIKAHLAMMGIDVPWRTIWISNYRAAALSLENYRQGRILFAGDAAHLVPIFGVRGLNSGFDDAYNLAWKLAGVLNGTASPDILDSYSQERRHAWEVNVSSAMKSTEFMAPQSRGYELMRDAVLSLAKGHPGLAALINPRQSRAISYSGSCLSTITRDEPTFAAGPEPGAPPLEFPVHVGRERLHFTQILGESFTLVVYGTCDSSSVSGDILALRERNIRISLILLDQSDNFALSALTSDLTIANEGGRFVALYDASPCAAYLFRPDGHVCARWRRLRGGDVADAISTALSVRKRE